jgi:hypothetical protein
MPPSPPTPCKRPDEYSPARVREGISYARTILKGSRKVTPITDKLLHLYANACGDLLHEFTRRAMGEDVSDTEMKASKREVYDHEQLLAKNDFLRGITSKEEREHIILGQSLLKLRRFEYQARYGNYFQKLVVELRVKANAHSIPGAERLTGNRKWIIINDEVEKELNDIDQLTPKIEKDPKLMGKHVLSEQTLDKVPTIKAIYKTCEIINFDWREMIMAIRSYSDRNLLMHNGLDQLLNDGNVTALAERIYKDLWDLPKVFSAEFAADEVMLESILGQLIAMWFEQPPDTEDEPTRWYPTEALKAELSNRRQGVKSRRSLENQVAAAAAAPKPEEKKAAAMLSKKIAREEYDLQLLEAMIEPPALALPDPHKIGAMPKGGGKRPASSLSSISDEDARKLRKKHSDAFGKMQSAWREGSVRFAGSSMKMIRDGRELGRRQAGYHAIWGISPEHPDLMVEPLPNPRSSSIGAVPAQAGGSMRPPATIPERHAAPTSSGSGQPTLPPPPSQPGDWELIYSQRRGGYVWIDHSSSKIVQ